MGLEELSIISTVEWQGVCFFQVERSFIEEFIEEYREMINEYRIEQKHLPFGSLYFMPGDEEVIISSRPSFDRPKPDCRGEVDFDEENFYFESEDENDSADQFFYDEGAYNDY